MATSSPTSAPPTKSPSSDTPSSRWSRTSDSGSAFGGRQPRGRQGGRVRTGSRNTRGTQNAREDQPAKSNDAPPSTLVDKPAKHPLPEKPTLSTTAPSNPPSATKPKHSSKRPSRANSNVNTSQSSPVAGSPVSPTSSRSSNHRRRSGTSKGNNIPKINPPAPQDKLSRPGRPRLAPVPHTAPIKDTPPHLASKASLTPTGSFDLSKDIDALVERVRAVAMAENHPSTPGSHIDWAGDDDDSLPDLDDWGITSLSVPDQKTQVISPIIVGGLKPLPELNAGSSTNGAAKPQDVTSNTKDEFTDAENPESQEPNAVNDGLVQQAPDEGPVLQSVLEQGAEQVIDPPNGRTDQAVPPSGDSQNANASDDLDALDSGGLTQSIHAPTPGSRPESEKGGLEASIHAPRAIVDSSSAPAQLGTRSPHSRQSHGRAHTVGRPFPRSNQNSEFSGNCSPKIRGRGGFHNSSRAHARNHSSPVTTTTRTSHSRPVLTGDAISRLAKVVGSTTTPPAKPTPVAND